MYIPNRQISKTSRFWEEIIWTKGYFEVFEGIEISGQHATNYKRLFWAGAKDSGSLRCFMLIQVTAVPMSEMIDSKSLDLWTKMLG
jgi:hypothetical protein